MSTADTKCDCYAALLECFILPGIVGIVQEYFHSETEHSIGMSPYPGIIRDAVVVHYDHITIKIFKKPDDPYSKDGPLPRKSITSFKVKPCCVRDLLFNTLAPENRDRLFRSMTGPGLRHPFIVGKLHDIINRWYCDAYARYMRIRHQ